MPVFSHLQELSATIFGVNVAYLALNQFRYKHTIQEHALHVIKNARLANENNLPKNIVTFELFQNLVYLSGPHANLYHVNAVVQTKENGNEENPQLLKETDYRKILPPNRDEYSQIVLEKFENKKDQICVQWAASISFIILILATIDNLYNFGGSKTFDYGGLFSSWAAFFVILFCFAVPLHWIRIGRNIRDATIKWIDKGAPDLFQLSWTWHESEQIKELPDLSDQRPMLDKPRVAKK
jgi:hypothetical protein